MQHLVGGSIGRQTSEFQISLVVHSFQTCQTYIVRLSQEGRKERGKKNGKLIELRKYFSGRTLAWYAQGPKFDVLSPTQDQKGKNDERSQ